MMETKEALSVRVLKEFNVPVEKLFAAWVSPNELKEWWHPINNQLKEVRNEVQQGGEILYLFQTENGEEAFQITGQYKEVKEKEKLVYTWNWHAANESLQDSSFLLTVIFTTQNNGSKLEVIQENFKNEESIRPHQQGWEKSLTDLAEYLSR